MTIEHQERLRPWRLRFLSSTQVEVIERLEREGGTLRRARGGYWSTTATPVDANKIPTWSVDIRTVRSMEKRGLLVRTGLHAQEWRDERRLVDGAATRDQSQGGGAREGGYGGESRPGSSNSGIGGYE